MENLKIKTQEELRKYINDKHTQEECVGFIDGIDTVFELLKSERSKETDLWKMLDEINVIMWESFMVKSKGFTEKDSGKIMEVLNRWAERY